MITRAEPKEKKNYLIGRREKFLVLSRETWASHMGKYRDFAP